MAAPRRERLPDTRQSITHKFNISGHEGYITVGLYPDGRPGELFITMAKEGSTIGGLMDCFGTAVSMSLQYGVPLEVYVNKFSHTRFEPMGFTKNPDIRIAKSIVDYIFRWLGITFLPGFREANKAMPRRRRPKRRTGEPGDAETELQARRHDGRRAERGPRIGQDRNGSRQRIDRRNGNGNGHGNGQRHAAKRNGAAAAQPPSWTARPWLIAEAAGLAAVPQRAVRLVPDRRPQLATIAARSPSATATATSATTAATAWAARRGKGRREGGSVQSLDSE